MLISFLSFQIMTENTWECFYGCSQVSIVVEGKQRAIQDIIKEQLSLFSLAFTYSFHLILQDRRNFVRAPPPGVDFPFDYDTSYKVATAVLAEDPNLEKMRFELVPKV